MKQTDRLSLGGNPADIDQTTAEDDILRTKLSLQSQQRHQPSMPPSSFVAAPDLRAGQQQQFQRSQIPQQHLQTFRHVSCIIDMCRTKVHVDLLFFFFVHTTLLMSQISTLSVQFCSLAGWQQQALATTEAYSISPSQHVWLHIQFIFIKWNITTNTFPIEHDHSTQ